MYHCHLKFYLAGHSSEVFDVIEKIPAEPNFFHSFFRKEGMDDSLIRDADVIFINLEGLDAEAVLSEIRDKKKTNTEVIGLIPEEDMASLYNSLDVLADIWVLPATVTEITFRFNRWKSLLQQRLGFWETSQYLEAVINSSPNMIWFKDRKGNHIKVNDAFCRIVNKTKKLVEGRDHCFIWGVGAEEARVCENSDREVMESKRLTITEEPVQTGNEVKEFITYKSPLFDLDGTVMGTVGLGLDVTQEKEYKKTLLQKNQTLEKLFTTLECGILRHDGEGNILSVNDAALRMLGYDTAEDLAAEGFGLFSHTVVEEDQEKLADAIRKLKVGGTASNLEYRIRHKDGEIVHVLGNMKLELEDGKPVYRRFMLDNTANKLAQNEKDIRNRDLVKALARDFNVVCAFDLNSGRGETLRLSDEIASKLGSIFKPEINFEECLHEYMQKYVDQVDHENFEKILTGERLADEFSKGNSFSLTFVKLTDEGKQYFEMKIVRVSDNPKKKEIVLGIRNVDSEVRLEREEKVTTLRLLEESKKANEAKTLFLSNMSHDIRTPMNAILGFTNLALSHITNTQMVQEHLKKIQISSNHLLSLINDVLDMSRIDSGQTKLTEAPCSLPELIENLRNIVAGNINEKHLSLDIVVEDLRNPEVLCDKLRLNQILINVLGNAVKYTKPGGKIKLTVKQLLKSLDDKSYYEFRIKDTGVGMSKEFLPKIFNAFEREQNSTTSGIVGTGLGMTITKNLLDKLEGEIEIHSELGVGTEVIMHIPLKVSEAITVDAVPSGADAGVHAPHPHSGRILLVEDNELNQEIAEMILTEAGFEVEIASNGREAVDRVKNSTPGYYKVVLMDILMPVMNGHEATKAIRRLDNPALAQIPILAMSANAFEEDKAQALKSGMNGHIAKPVDVDKLFEALDRFIPDQESIA